MSTRTLRAAGLALCAGLLSTTAIADDLIVPMGATNNRSNITASQYNAVSFTFNADFTDVAIEASLTSSDGSAGGGGTAYLTNQLGAGTTAANIIAQTDFTFATVGTFTDISFVSLFSGLSLDAGTYFVMFGAPFNPSTAGGGITLGTAVTYTTDPDVTVGDMLFASSANIDAGFAPASTFSTSGLGNRVFRVTGVPAPGSLALLGVAGLATTRRRR